MAFRVDDIAVTDRNILLLSGGHQFVADIEKDSDALDSDNFSRDRNPWNFYSSDGKIYHNLFDTAEFDIRTQVLTGSTRHSPNNSRSHEKIHMPHEMAYVGNCQFYDNAYSISDFTSASISSDVVSADGMATFVDCHGFIRYDSPSAYENPTECYIAPKCIYTVDSGVQYMTEYPLNGFYNDFGDNESDERPTVFGDSVLLKYYLDSSYSVSSYDIDGDMSSRFRQLRTYYDIGNTGNSIYLVFRNDRSGLSIPSDVDESNASNESVDSYTLYCPISGLGYMQNIVTLSCSGGVVYSSDPYSDMFNYAAMDDVSASVDIRSPKDKSFILYFNRLDTDGSSKVTLTYLPKIGLERSKYVKIYDENYDDLSIVELEHSIAIGTKGNGIITVWSRDYLYDGSNTLVDFNPFQSACSGIPSFESLSSTIDGEKYENIKLFFNGRDMLGATAEVSGDKRIAFFSANFEDSERSYEIGHFFMPAAHPLYETKIVPSTDTITSEVLSSVPVPSKTESGTITSWSYVLSSIAVETVTRTTTSEMFECSENAIADMDILFDYSSTEVEGELSIGSYAFVQFAGYGLGKCFVDDIYSQPKMVKFTSTGPVNTGLENLTCTDVSFSVNSYGEDYRKKMLDTVEYVPSDYNASYVSGKPALRATFRNNDNTYVNSFSVFPLNGRTEREDIVKEPLFATADMVDVEMEPISSYRFAMNRPIQDSMAVTLKTFKDVGINHDAAISLVRWNNTDGKTDAMTLTSLGGCHLQYNGICTDVYMNGSVTSRVDDDSGEAIPYYSSTIYEYPHPCYGQLKTAGTGLPIFDGPLSDNMKNDDLFFVNGYFVVKNYSVDIFEGKTESGWKEMANGETIWESGKHLSHNSGRYPSGGYVVTNFFAEKGAGNEIPSLYGSELLESSKDTPKTVSDSERFYDYSYLWQIKPMKPIEFYPESKDGRYWKPYYVSKYVDFIKYHNGYYYISIRSAADPDAAGVVGYDIIETDTLFVEKKLIPLKSGLTVSDVRFFDNHVAVEYHDSVENKNYIKWFESGKSYYKVMPVSYTGLDDGPYPAMKHATVSTAIDSSSTVVASYDNVEVVNSLNRFTPIVNHKSNLFSVRVEDLGFEESNYLSDYQKSVLGAYFKNGITEIVNMVKPAHTQLFDVYLS